MADAAWLPADLNRPALAPIQGRIGARTASEYRQVIDQFCVETSERYRKRDVDGRPGDETFCNFFMREVLVAMGVSIPLMRANDYQDWLEKHSPTVLDGWTRSSQWSARALANCGHPTVVVWTNPDGPHGHVALVVPARTELERDAVTFIAQAGSTNFSYGRLTDGFGRRPVAFYAHP